MPGGFDSGFDSGFGPLPLASGVTIAALAYFLNLLKPQEIKMDSKTISGANASGLIVPGPSQGIQVEGIEIAIPLDEVGSTDPSITLSGAITGAVTFHSSCAPVIRFYKDEQVYLTTTNFIEDYTAVVKYVVYGSQESYLNTRNMGAIPLPSRLTRRTPRSA